MAAHDLPIRRARRDRVVERIGPAHRDAQPIEQRSEMVELTFCLVRQRGEHRLSAERRPASPGGKYGNSAGS